jgi:exosortase
MMPAEPAAVTARPAGLAGPPAQAVPGTPLAARWAGAGLLAALLAVLYAPVLPGLVADWWDDPNYSHGFLVPLFSGYLVWQRRAELAGLTPHGSMLGLPVLLAGIGALILGEVGAELFITRSSLILVLAGLVLFHLGGRALRVVAFPLGYLVFMVPLPAIVFFAVAFPLQSLAAQNAAWVLDQMGVPVLLDGNVIQLSQITLGVTEACSGVRSLISLLALAVAWAHLTLLGLAGMAVLVASVVPITVAANAGRIVATGLIGQTLGIEYATGFFHTFSGWIIFLFAFAGLLGVHAVIRLVPGLRGGPTR